MRLFSMLVMLAVLYMLWDRARDPNLWKWFADEPSAEEEKPSQTGAGSDE